jgi:hypothetical protein
LKEYLEGTKGANAWAMSKVENNALSNFRKMPLKSNEPMYDAMEEFVGQ